MIGVIINDTQTITFEEAAEVASKRKGRKVRAIPHNSKCRCGEREVQAAKQKAQIILDAAKVSAASGGYSEPKQGQRSQSARGFCPRSTMRVPQPDIIEHFCDADCASQPQQRCLSCKAGIVRCCLRRTRLSSTLCVRLRPSAGWLQESPCRRFLLPPAFRFAGVGVLPGTYLGNRSLPRSSRSAPAGACPVCGRRYPLKRRQSHGRCYPAPTRGRHPTARTGKNIIKAII